jgi:hypothetical protein
MTVIFDIDTNFDIWENFLDSVYVAYPHNTGGFLLVKKELEKYNGQYKIVYKCKEIIDVEEEFIDDINLITFIEFESIEGLVEFKLRWA